MSETAAELESTAAKKTEAEAAADDKFFKSCYGTMSLSIAPVAAAWLIYFVWYRSYIADGPEHLLLTLLAIGIGLLIIVAANVLVGGATFVGLDLQIPDNVRNAFLPIMASLWVVDLAIICSLTGGATSSPFAHLLTAIGGLAILYAEKLWTRALLLIAVIAAFYQSGIHFIPACGSTNPANPANPACSGNPPVLPDILWFHCLCLVIVAGLAVLAAARQPPRRTARRKNKKPSFTA